MLKWIFLLFVDMFLLSAVGGCLVVGANSSNGGKVAEFSGYTKDKDEFIHFLEKGLK